MKVYLVTDGDYSDYHIIGAFSSEDKANIAIKVTGGEIEEYELDEIGKDNRYLFLVRLGNYFDGKDATSVNYIRFDKEDYINKVYHSKFRNEEWFTVSVMAEDQKHAIKIASDLVAQYKANAK